MDTQQQVFKEETIRDLLAYALIEQNLGAKPRRENNGNLTRLILASGVLFQHVYAAKVEFASFLPWVAMFVTLSGYLVLGSRESSRSTLHFYWKRVLRIWPAMAAYFLANLCLTHGNYSATGRLLAGTFLIHGPGFGPWTITLEECLYIVLAGSWALGLYRNGLAAWAGLLISLAPTLWIPMPTEWTYLWQIVPLFFVGNLLYLYRSQLAWNWQWAVASILAAVLWKTHASGGLTIVVYEGLLAYPLIWFALHAREIFRMPLADISYGLFLYHGILQGTVLKLAGGFWPSLLGLWGISCLVALASWHFLEAPALTLKNWRILR